MIAASLRWWQDQAASLGCPQAGEPWSRADGWSLSCPQRRTLRWQIGDAAVHRVTLTQARDGQLSIEVLPTGSVAAPPQATPLALGQLRPSHEAPHAIATTTGWAAQVDRHGDTFDAFTAQGHLTLRWLDPLQQRQDSAAHAGQVSAPMPGKVVALLVKAGEQVSAGQPVVVTEAMKMEHTLTSPRDGRVAEMLCRVGDQVPEGTELLRIESE